MSKTKIGTELVRRRAKRGRPRKDEHVKYVTKPIFVARDPQGVKLFTIAPRLSVLGLWEGRLMNGIKPMDPRSFVMKFRNARLPERGAVLPMRMAT